MMPKPIRTNKRKPTRPLWKGPVEDGISFSLLSKFLVCRERFRLKVVEGLDEDEGFNHNLEFGSLWHEAEEAHAAGKDWRPALTRYKDKLRSRYPGDEDEIRKWFNVAKTTFPFYVRHWKKHKVETKRVPVLEEESFRVPLVLPSGRTITLRGKWDAVFRNGRSIYLQENKTKGRIDEAGLQGTVDQNLQTMIYRVALNVWMNLVKSGDIPPNLEPKPSKTALKDVLNCTVKGTLYNVVRRPLSDLHCIKQRKGREVWNKDKTRKVRKGAETEKEFFERLAKDVIEPEAKSYFMRWKVLLTNKDVDRFRLHSLDPILEGLLDWWEWIAGDFNNPWRVPNAGELVEGPLVRCPGGGVHHQAPWGVYNSMFGGFRGDFFEYLTTGRKTGLKTIKTLFPEL